MSQQTNRLMRSERGPISFRAKFWDRVLSLYGRRIPYHPGKWRVIALLEQRAREAWTAPRIARCGGIWYELDLRDFMSRAAYFSYETRELKFIRSIVRPRGVVVDAGANIGMYSLTCSKLVGDSGHVYAFEPVSFTADRLDGNIALNESSNITVVRAALGSRCGIATMRPVDVRSTGKTQVAARSEAGFEEVPIMTLDSFAEAHGLTRLDLVKVDIEGSEAEFLKGGGGQHQPLSSVPCHGIKSGDTCQVWRFSGGGHE